MPTDTRGKEGWVGRLGSQWLRYWRSMVDRTRRRRGTEQHKAFFGYGATRLITSTGCTALVGMLLLAALLRG